MLFVAAVFAIGRASAVDDVVVNPAPPGKNFEGKMILDADTVDRLIFGTDAKLGRQKIETQIAAKVREIDARYELTDDARRQLELAARADKIRFLNAVDDLRQKVGTGSADTKQWQQISREAALLRNQQHELFGSSSFFSKVKKKVLATAEKKNPETTNRLLAEKKPLKEIDRKPALAKKVLPDRVKIRNQTKSIDPPADATAPVNGRSD
jgi:hypothetical protein